jgi:hypothetical protein
MRHNQRQNIKVGSKTPDKIPPGFGGIGFPWDYIIGTSRKLKGYPKTGVRAYARTPGFGLLLFI